MDELDWISTSDELRILNEVEFEKLNKQELVSDFKRNKLEIEAQKNWDRFYHRNADNFFKDRHWTKRDLESILDDVNLTDALVFLEAGCGVGNMLFPLAEYFPHWTLQGFDFSKNAIELLQKRASELNIYMETRLIDLTAETSSHLSPLCTKFHATADVLSLIFVLSAISPEKHRLAVCNLRQFLRPGSNVLVRDYGALDHAMLRFGRGTKLSERFYGRQDGTRAYFFVKEELIALFEDAGFETRRCEYLYKKTINHKKELSVDRVFVQMRFVLK